MSKTRADTSVVPETRLETLGQVAFFVVSLYLFFVSIDLMSVAFKLAGAGFAGRLLLTASDPVAGLIIGCLATSIVQSSSSTTSIVVGLVAAGTIPLPVAVPIIMGANIGTTVTNTIVSMGFVTKPTEFKRAFAASTVHDFFNILAVIVLLPIEVLFHPIEKSAILMEKVFVGAGGIQFVSPLKMIIKPASHAIADMAPHSIILLLIALAGLFFSISRMVKIMRKLVLTRVGTLFDRVLFRNAFQSFGIGMVLTAIVQSSSAMTSLIVPLAGTGVLTLRQIFPYTLGANIGTTITAILASFALGSEIALTVAFCHLMFNVWGIVLLYPARAVPIWLATRTGELAGRSRRSGAIIVAGYVSLYLIPILYLVLR